MSEQCEIDREAALAADIVDATTYENIAGQWCGDVTDYIFTPNTLTVKRQTTQCVRITKYTYTNDSVRIGWLNDAGPSSRGIEARAAASTRAT
jgi:hypothetical protein